LASRDLSSGTVLKARVMSDQGIEDICSITPLQQGLLFHSLLLPQSGLYVDQFLLDLPGNLNIPALENAWRQVIERHAILRTSFHWENLTNPLQVVHREAKLTTEMRDWRAQPDAVQRELLENYLSEDRERGFDLSAAPLMRQLLIQTKDDAYYLVWSFHHLIMDGWSSGIVQAELFSFYEAWSRNERLDLDPVIPFSAYIAWLRQQDLVAAEGFWRRKLKGLGNRSLAIATREPNRSQPSVVERSEHEIQLSPILTSELQSFARQQHLTLNTLLLGAFALLVGGQSGEREIVVGVVVSGRPEAIAGVESMVGNFINTLPARISFNSDNMLDWLRQLQLTQLELRNYQYTPLVEIKKWSELPASQSLFETIFVFENSFPGAGADGNKSELEIRNVRHLFKTNYPLTVQVSPAERLRIRVEYDSLRFTSEVIAQLLSKLEGLLRTFVATPPLSSAKLRLLPEQAASQPLPAWNETKAAYPRSATLPQLFEVQAQKTPTAIALKFEEQRLTYAELNAQANRLAHHLRSLGVGHETSVGICMERSADMVVCALGVLKAGGVCVPLDPTYPKERLSFMIRNAHARILLMQAGQELLPDVTAVYVEPGWQNVQNESETELASDTRADNLAYIVYTSGSTGVPKGVEIHHRAVVRLLINQNYVDLNGSETFLHLSPPSFDASFFEIWGALLHGGRCVVLPSRAFSTFELARVLKNNGVNVLWLTASLFNSVIDSDAKALAGISQLIIGGESLSVPHVTRALERLPNTRLVNGYGPTENTTFSTSYVMAPELDATSASVPIGRPIANTQVYVLDQQMNPLPVGAAGDLYVGGDGLARGYLNEPGLTAEKFVPNPYSEEPGARLYRTGDRARYLLQGDLEFLGRRDEQVKVRGYRIELGEIEGALQMHPQVGQVVAVAQEQASGEKRVVAYLVAAQGAALGVSEVRSFLAARLPEYMIPSAFVMIEAMPLTASGKVNRRELTARRLSVVDSVANVGPRTLIEELLAEIWLDVLGLERVGIHDDFLEIGGHSLLAIRLIARLREAFQIELHLATLFEFPTVASLAAKIENELNRGPDLSPLPLVRSSRVGPPRLSLAQQRLWILDQLDPGAPVHNIAIAVRVQGPLNITALAVSLNKVAERHDVLRMHVEMRGGLPVQVIASALNVNLPSIDVDGVTKAEREVAAQQLAREEGRRRFDLSNGPLFRASLLKIDSDDYILVLAMHHIVSDGQSLEILVREMGSLYQHFSEGSGPLLPELPIQYADYAEWQRSWVQDDKLQRQLAYWKTQLAHAPAGLDVHGDHPRPPVQTFNGAQETFAFSPHLSQALRKLTRNEHVTPFMTLLAAFQSLLHRYTGEKDLLVGTVVANRDQVATEPLIGFFVNTLVLRARFSDDPTFREILHRLRGVVLEAYAHQDIPFEKLVEELQPERNLSLSPLFQILFTYQHSPTSSLEIPGLSVSFMNLETGTAKFDLSLSMVDGERGLNGILEYNRELFDATTIRRMIKHFIRLLEGVTEHPELPISRQELLSPEEQIRLVVEWNDTGRDHPRDLCIHQLFEGQVERTPDDIALICNEEQLTYRALDMRANQLARYLQRLGVQPEVPVGIFMSRSTEMIVGLLAILKAGGAYLPLDPAYPEERVAFMMADVGARVLLTEEQYLERLPVDAGTVITLNGAEAPYASESGERIQVDVDPRDLAYLIYTSGSTGRPKGVAIEHRNAVTLLHWAHDFYSDADLSCVPAVTSTCFDISVFEIFAPLSRGGRIILVENALSLLALRQADELTLINTVPSAMTELLRANKLPSSVRTVNLAGELIPASLIEQLHRQRSVERVFNLYGPSEDTTYSTAALVQQDFSKSVAIGRPISNKQIYLLDPQLQLVPPGAVGEVFIGGEGLSRGYYGQSDSTAEAFLPNPFSEVPGSRFYRTGDLARHRSDGQLDFLGRVDNQVKVRGFRIELDEIATVLGRHAEVSEAVVTVRQEAMSQWLVAYVVPHPNRRPGVAGLQSFLQAKLPDYMVPNFFVMLETLPRLPNGKVDRRALPAFQNHRTQAIMTHTPPRNDLEDVIAGVWKEVLGTSEVGIHDNFFSNLGGHSLLAIQAVTKLREVLDLQLSFVALFQFPTVSSLAEHLENGGDWRPAEQAAEHTLQRQEALRQRRLLKQSRLSKGAG
jgi:amino acid adenylation domain-containing protein